MNTDSRPSNTLPHLFISRDFTLLWCGQAISQVGDFLFNTTLVLWLATHLLRGQLWSPLAVSGILLAASLPLLIVRPLAGVFVDRWEKRRTMLTMDASRVVLISLLVLMSTGISLPFSQEAHLSLFWQLALIYAIVFLVSTCSQFFSPALFALTGEIVSGEDLPRATGLNLVMVNLAMLIGPALAGPLFFAFGVQWAFVINLLSYAISFLTILFVHTSHPATHLDDGPGIHFFLELREGFSFLVSNRVLLAVMIALSVAMLGIGALLALDVFFFTQNLHAPASLYGLLSAAFGAGSIIGASFGSRVVKYLGLFRTFWLSMLAVGVTLLIFARQTSFVPGLLVFFLLGIPNATSNVAFEPIIFLMTPRRLVGRVNSVIITSCNVAAMFSEAIAGYLASSVLRGFHITLLNVSFGSIDTLFMGTGLLVLAGGIYAMARLRAGNIEPSAGQ